MAKLTLLNLKNENVDKVELPDFLSQCNNMYSRNEVEYIVLYPMT